MRSLNAVHFSGTRKQNQQSLSPWRLNSGASQRCLLSLKEENENVHIPVDTWCPCVNVLNS